MTARKAFAWAVSGQLVVFAVGFLGQVVLTRLLLPREFGVYAIASAALGFVAAFTGFGTGANLERERDLTEEMKNAAFSINAALSVGISVVTTGVALASDVLLKSPDAGHVLYWLAVTPLIGIATFGPSSMMQRHMQFKQLALVNTVTVLTSTFVTIACAYAGLGYMSPAYGAIASSVVNLVAYAFVGRQYFHFHLTRSGWRPILAFGLQMLTIGGAASMSFRLSDIFLGRLLGVEALGLFSRASTLSNQIFDNVYGTATRVMFSKLSQDFRDTGELKHSFLKSFRMITAVMWPFLTVLAISSPVLIQVLYGERWHASALPLSILLVAQIIVLSFGMNWELFVIKSETGRQTRIELARNVLGLVAFMIGSAFSVAAAAAGRVVDAIFGLLMYRSHVSRLSGADVKEITPIYVEGALLTVAAALPLALLMAFEGWSAHTDLRL
ncbi:MAG: hypothetical protein JWQ11_2675, partial [Rhizobacter sp.]|nr:hypothetical protein [Rhizobacter sp.]